VPSPDENSSGVTRTSQGGYPNTLANPRESLGQLGITINRTIVAAPAAVSLAAPAMAQTADVSRRLVLYTSRPNEDAQRTVDAFTTAYPNVEVEWIRDGTTQGMARLGAEFAAGSPQPDVLPIADTVTMEVLEAQGRLLSYAGADVSAYDPSLMDPEGHYFSRPSSSPPGSSKTPQHPAARLSIRASTPPRSSSTSSRADATRPRNRFC
jgi:hypothetical protein